jgi:hypothetical protein
LSVSNVEPANFVTPPVIVAELVKRVEAHGSVVHRGSIELNVVLVGLAPGRFEIDHEVTFGGFRVSVEVDVGVRQYERLGLVE